jgi:hypothetical protein
MVSQMRAQYESFVAPIITVNIVLKHSTVICLKIKNAGHSPAKNVRFSLSKDFYQFAEFKDSANVRNYPPFQTPIPSFSPGDEIFLMLSQGFNLGKTHEGALITPLQFALDSQYTFGDRSFSHCHEIDLRPYMKTSQDKNEILDELE